MNGPGNNPQPAGESAPFRDFFRPLPHLDADGAIVPPDHHPVWRLALELEQSQWWSSERVQEWQLERVNMMLAHCRNHVRFYQQLHADGRLPEEVRSLDDFRQIPLLDRVAVQQSHDLLQAESLPAGSRVVDDANTSGTSGIAVRVRRSSQVALMWSACYLRDLHWCGLDPRLHLVAIRAVHGESPPPVSRASAWVASLAPLIESGPAHVISQATEVEDQLRWLTELNPDYLLGNPSHLKLLAGLMAERGWAFPCLAKIQTIADTLDDDARQRIESGFGVPVADTYSCAEAGYLASPCPQGHGAHVHAENVVLEVLGDDGAPCGPGETGRVVLTTLHNYQMPLLRYDIGDRATVGQAPCPCGRGLPLLTRVLGKRRPLWELPDGRWLNTSEVATRLTDSGGFHQFQLVRSAADRLTLNIVPASETDADRRRRWQQSVEELAGPAVTLEVRHVSRIESTRGGKFPAFLDEADAPSQ